jgi:aminopeptidase
MVDPRETQLAELLVDYSVGLEAGENVCLLTDSTQALPLFREVYKTVIVRGGYPYPHVELDPHVGFEGMDYTWMKHASDEQLRHLSRIRFEEMKAMDAYVRIGAPANKVDLAGIDPKRIAMRRRTTKPILDERLRKKWVVTRFPAPSMAQAASMSTEDFADFFYNACLIDWGAQSKIQEGIKEKFESGKVVRILGDETDLYLGIEGRKVKKCIGECQYNQDLQRFEGANMPDGEVYFGPVEDFTHGYIKYTYPYNMQGQKIDGISLTFEHGKIVEFKAETNQKALASLLNTDDGACRLGECGIGTNPGITRFMDELLFDEKILGTVHVTPGNSYEGRGVNKSAIHADIVKDLRPERGGGELQVDGEVVQKNGKWTFI